MALRVLRGRLVPGETRHDRQALCASPVRWRLALAVAPSLAACSSVDAAPSPVDGVKLRMIRSNGIDMRITERARVRWCCSSMAGRSRGIRGSTGCRPLQQQAIAQWLRHARLWQERQAAGISDYDIHHVSADLVGILDALGEKTAILVEPRLGRDRCTGTACCCIRTGSRHWPAMSVPYGGRGARADRRHEGAPTARTSTTSSISRSRASPRRDSMRTRAARLSMLYTVAEIRQPRRRRSPIQGARQADGSSGAASRRSCRRSSASRPRLLRFQEFSRQGFGAASTTTATSTAIGKPRHSSLARRSSSRWCSCRRAGHRHPQRPTTEGSRRRSSGASRTCRVTLYPNTGHWVQQERPSVRSTRRCSASQGLEVVTSRKDKRGWTCSAGAEF